MQAIQTAEQWNGVLADLSAKRQTLLDHLEALRNQKAELALESAMGNSEARKKLEKCNAELTKAALELDSLELAGAEADRQKRQAEKSESVEAERQRKQEVAEALQSYLAEVKLIDNGLRLLSKRFAAAKQALDRAELLMTPQERAPIQQLRSKFAATLAAASYGIGDYLSLGREAAHAATHGQSLETFTKPYVEPWLPQNANGNGNGNKE